MAKDDVVAAGVQAVQQGEEQVLRDQLGAAYDQGAFEQKAADGTLSQADVDAAVAQAKADQAAVDAAAMADVQAKLDVAAASMTDLQSKYDDLVAADAALQTKEAGEAGLLGQLASAKDQLQAVLDGLKALPSVQA